MHRSATRSLTKLIAGTVLAIGSVSVLPSAQADAYRPYEPSFLRQAERALSAHQPERALEILTTHRDGTLKNRHRASVYGISCRANLELDRPEAAKRDCETALTLERSRANWGFFNNLGVAELSLGNLEAAEAAFTNAAVRSGYAREPRKNLDLLQSLTAPQIASVGERRSGVTP